jgi:hypothetical protein
MLSHNVYFYDLPILLLVVSLVYSATRYDEWSDILRESLRWVIRLTSFLGAIGVVLYFMSKL